MVTVQYHGPHDAVEIEHPVGRFVEILSGVPTELPESVAGVAPSGDDPGSGLLAQPDNWQVVTPTKPKKAAAAAEES